MSESSTYRIENGVLKYLATDVNGVEHECEVDVFAAREDLRKLASTHGTDDAEFLPPVADMVALSNKIDARIPLHEADLFVRLVIAAEEAIKKKHESIAKSLVFTE